MEQGFSRKVKQSRIHDCTVVVGCNIFLVSAYWEENDNPNTAVRTACLGLEWRGEIAIVQAGRFITFYKDVRNLSAASKAVSKLVASCWVQVVATMTDVLRSRFISEYKYSIAVGASLPTNLEAAL